MRPNRLRPPPLKRKKRSITLPVAMWADLDKVAARWTGEDVKTKTPRKPWDVQSVVEDVLDDFLNPQAEHTPEDGR